MIKFFRKIRYDLMEKNKTVKYLKYAIGEIFLVMIGILLALQVNNWNENRKATNSERILLVNLVKDLELEEIRFNQNLNGIDGNLKTYEQLYLIGVKGRNDITIENPNKVRNIVNFDPKLNKDYSLISDKLTNEEIREDLLKYNHRLKSIEVGFIEYRKVITDRMRIYLGEKGLYKLESLYTNKSLDEIVIFDLDELINLAKTNEFQQLLFEAKLKLDAVDRRLNNIVQQNIELRNKIEGNLNHY